MKYVLQRRHRREWVDDAGHPTARIALAQRFATVRRAVQWMRDHYPESQAALYEVRLLADAALPPAA